MFCVALVCKFCIIVKCDALLKLKCVALLVLSGRSVSVKCLALRLGRWFHSNKNAESLAAHCGRVNDFVAVFAL